MDDEQTNNGQIGKAICLTVFCPCMHNNGRMLLCHGGRGSPFCAQSKQVPQSTASVKASMLRPVKEQAGLGCPPDAFTTNVSKSVNALLKNKVDYKRHELPAFLEKLRQAINEQEK